VSFKREIPLSAERKATVVVLGVAAILGWLSLFGPAWLVRVGLVVAVAGAATSVWLAFKEISRLEVLHRKELKAVQHTASSQAQAHHAEAMDLITTFQQRTRAHGEQLAEARAQLAGVQQELSTTRGNLLSARNEAAQHQEHAVALQGQLDLERALVAELRAQMATDAADLAREAELASADPDVVRLPRRVVSRKALAATLPTAAELWRDGEHPTGVNEALTHLPEVFERRHA